MERLIKIVKVRKLPRYYYNLSSEKSNKNIPQKAYQRLFYQPQHYNFQIDDITRSQIKPKKILSIVDNISQGYSIQTLLEMAQFAIQYRQIFQYICVVFIQNIYKAQLESNKNIYNLMNQPNKIIRIVKIFQKIEKFINIQISNLTCLYIGNIIKQFELSKMDFIQGMDYLISQNHCVADKMDYYIKLLKERQLFLKQQTEIDNKNQYLIKRHQNYIIIINAITNLKRYYQQKFQQHFSYQFYKQYIDIYLQELLNPQMYKYIKIDYIFYLVLQILNKYISQNLFMKNKQCQQQNKNIKKGRKINQYSIQFIFDIDANGGIYLGRFLIIDTFEVLITLFSYLDKQFISKILFQYQKAINNSLIENQEFLKLIPLQLYEQYRIQSPFLINYVQQNLVSKPFLFSTASNSNDKRSYDYLLMKRIHSIILKISPINYYQISQRHKSTYLNQKYQTQKRFQEQIKSLNQYLKNINETFFKFKVKYDRNYYKNIQNSPTIENIKMQRILIGQYNIETLAQLLVKNGIQRYTAEKYQYFSYQMPICRLALFIQYIIIYHKFSNGQPLDIRYLFRSKHKFELIRDNICFPNLLKNLVSLFQIYQNNFKKDSSQYQKQLLIFVDQCRNQFSKCFNNLDKFSYYKCNYNLQFIGCDWLKNLYKINYEKKFKLTQQNIYKNLTNDIYMGYKFNKNRLKQLFAKKMIQRQQSLQFKKLKIFKDYIQYPYYTDYFIKKRNKLFAIFIKQQQCNQKYLLNQIQNQFVEYFKKYKFQIYYIKKQEDIDSCFQFIENQK